MINLEKSIAQKTLDILKKTSWSSLTLNQVLQHNKNKKIHIKSKFDLLKNVNRYVDDKLINKMKNDSDSKGILICGTGNGMSISANRHNNIRAGLAFNIEIAKLIREHNDANVLILPGRFIDVQEALKCVDIFLSTDFHKGRHKRRINKIGKL